MLGRIGIFESILILIVLAIIVTGGYYLVKNAVKKGKLEAQEKIDTKNENEDESDFSKK
ncbi:hypothetical protein [Natranaerobius thermophilus]|uniref:Uncharacterized protein n=1 Tax=Natranaerobius thermophilus (strain ATCC BAA-1301 / DSM 18059 / JW/NM-WN-LF) TaxID=457570 RepID=B2A1U4_NATTJ|nr:hypothetical protein [Natranaerobius thermophilus]ACB86141.1 hypothetical protein Nther_2585 [Natranaerobius thermophilus JW/NM-WN-LF]